MKQTGRYLSLFMIIMVIPLLLTAKAGAATMHVNKDGSDGAYTSIQTAINASVNGDEIIVHDGTYMERISYYGKAVTVRSENGASVTIINGGGYYNLNFATVNFKNQEGAGSVLDGFTITGGNSWNGGGISCMNSSSPTVKNCVIDRNNALYGGGVKCDYYSNLAISDCVISNNTSTRRSGGLECYRSSIKVTNCVFSGNTDKGTYSGHGGGGASIFGGGNIQFSNCEIKDNVAYDYGGIAVYEGASLKLVNCIVSGNRANNYNGGIFVWENAARVDFINCTIADNIATSGPGGVYTRGNQTYIANSIIWGNTRVGIPADLEKTAGYLNIRYSDIRGGWTGPGTNNIDADPLFAGIKNYHLSEGSPCIDAGDPLSAPPDFPETDIDGEPRPMGATYDMGADEAFEINLPPVANAGEDVDISSDEINITTIPGTASDPDSNLLEYRWLDGQSELSAWTPVGQNGECPLILNGLSLTMGTHELALEVRDEKTVSADIMVLNLANTAPHAAVSGGGVIEINTDLVLRGEVSDYDGDLLNYSWLENGNVICSGQVQSVPEGISVALPDYTVTGLGLGVHTFILQVNDGFNDAVTAQVNVQVVDTSEPTLTPQVNGNLILWPPDHQMESFSITTNAEDNSGLIPALTIRITSNEPEDGLGDGDTGPDWTEPVIDQSTGIVTFNLRAERSGSGKGRVYMVIITATDESGNSSEAFVEFVVPHDKRKK